MTEQRRLAAILAADVAGYSRLIGANEEGTLLRLRALRADIVDPAIAANRGRVFHTAGDSVLAEFASVVDAARCAVALQHGLAERNADLLPEKHVEFRIGVHLGDVVAAADGDLLGDSVNVAARLEGIAEPGGIALSHAAYDQVRDKLREQFDDLGEWELKNIARPVRVFAISPRAGSVPPAPPRRSIVVLPFANIGGDPEQEYFVDGITESLTTDLSRIRHSVVIGRHTAFSYKGKAVDLRQVGRELGVRYVLEGSVQRAANRIRINVQLIDAETGTHLWAERFDRDYGDLFEMQDEIVARIANSLNAQFIAAEARRAERAVNPDSMDLYFRAQAILNRGVNEANFAAGRELFERSITLDPENVEALVGLTFFLIFAAASGIGGNVTANIAAAGAAATRATALAPEFALAHAALGYVHALSGQADKAIAEGEHALGIDPNCELGHGSIAIAKARTGRHADVEPHVRAALRLNPRGILVYGWYVILGTAKLYTGEYEAAIHWLTQSIEANPNYPASHFYLAAALARLGRLEEARAAAQAGFVLEPSFTIGRLRAATSNDPAVQQMRERAYEGMRQAGIPEG